MFNSRWVVFLRKSGLDYFIILGDWILLFSVLSWTTFINQRITHQFSFVCLFFTFFMRRLRDEVLNLPQRKVHSLPEYYAAMKWRQSTRTTTWLKITWVIFWFSLATFATNCVERTLLRYILSYFADFMFTMACYLTLYVILSLMVLQGK